MGRGRGRSGDLSPEEAKLWEEYARDIKKLGGKARAPSATAAPRAPAKKSPLPAEVLPTASKKSVSSQPPQLDGRTDSKLKRGKLPVEATLDLHGCTQAQAHNKLNDFILRSHKGGKRCVLVITGKGKQTPERAVGVLKEKLPQWLSLEPLRGLVLKLYPAAIKDGGSGAWYVYLRRDRG